MRRERVEWTGTVHCSDEAIGCESHLLQKFCAKHAGLMPHLHCISIKIFGCAMHS